jgi:hypothetical protein
VLSPKSSLPQSARASTCCLFSASSLSLVPLELFIFAYLSVTQIFAGFICLPRNFHLPHGHKSRSELRVLCPLTKKAFASVQFPNGDLENLKKRNLELYVF